MKELRPCARRTHGGLTWGVVGGAEVINHGGDQGATQDVAGDKGGKGSCAEAKATRHPVVRDTRSDPRGVTEARSCPSREASRSWSRTSH